MCDIHAPIRAGTDIVFLGALINYVINSERWNTDPFFKEYVVNYTNAATLVNPDFKDTEDLNGVFSGLSADGKYLFGRKLVVPAPCRAGIRRRRRQNVHRSPPAASPRPAEDRSHAAKTRRPSSRSSRSTMRAIRPRWSSASAAAPKETFLKVAETLLNNSGRDKTSNITYAVGWTQHTVGVQIIRCGGDAAGAARQHRQARRRRAGAARPRLDPGFDRHRHAVPLAARAT